MAIKRVCMLCKKTMGWIPGDDTGESHGICDECLPVYRREWMGIVEEPTKKENNSRNAAFFS